MSLYFFAVLAALIVASAIGVVALVNPIYSALCLVTNLLAVAGVFALLDAHFLAAVQVIVYAGAIMVLVIFVLMLLNLKIENPKRLNAAYTVLAIIASVLFMAMLAPLFKEAFGVFPEARLFIDNSSAVGSVRQIGVELYTRYIYPFELASLLIIAAIAGAVMLAKRNRRQAGVLEGK